LTEDGKQLLPVRVAAESITSHVDVALVEGGHIAGTVSDAKTGLPLAGIRVTFQANTGPGWSTWSTGYESATTGADGTYISGGLATNSYCVEFYDPDDQYPFLRCYGSEPYGGLDDSFASVMVTAPQTTGGIDARLVKWGQVAGQVSENDYGRPLPGIRVALEVYYWDSDPVHRPRGWSWGEVAEQDSTAEGRYHFDRWYDRIYRVRFSDPAGIYHAETVDIGQLSGHPDPTNINIALDLHERVTGHIAGTATVRWTGAPAVDVEVNVFQAQTQWWPVSFAKTDAVGTYDIAGLAPGDYQVQFGADHMRYPERFIPVYYDHAANVDTAKNVTVIAGMVVNDIDAELVERGRIVGRVFVQATGQPLANRVLEICCAYGSYAYGQTDANGQYKSGPLLAGNYTVTFSDSNGRFGSRSVSAVVADEHGPVRVDLAIAETRGQITGRVVDEVSGRPLYGIQIRCCPKGKQPAEYCGGYTDTNGKYTTRFLDAGAYRLQFVDPQGRYLTEVYDQA